VSKRYLVKSLRVAEEEYLAIERAAQAQGLSFGAYLRRAGLGSMGSREPALEPPAQELAPANSEAGPASNSAGAEGPERAGALPAMPRQTVGALTVPFYSLDDIGPDPLRGGAGSARR